MALTHLRPSSINDQAPAPKAAGPARRSRQALCRPSADTLQLGLGLLAIPSLERMGAAGCVGVGGWGWDLASGPAASNPFACLGTLSLGSILCPHAPSQPRHGRRPCPATSWGLLQEALLGECAWAVTADKIDAVVARLVAVAAPLRLIAFGSAARGPLEGANDLDLLVVEPTGANRYSEVVRLQKALRGLLIPVDLVVSSQAATNQRCHGPGTLEFAARTQGRLLHDSL